MTDPTRHDHDDTTGGRLRIEAPETSLNDERLPVRVSGAPPNESVALLARFVDDEGAEWTSRATFTADADGVVDLTTDAPDSGSYAGAEPMGWCWSMKPDADALFPTFERAELPVTFRATAGDRAVERTVTRLLYDPAITSHEVVHDEVVGDWYEPADDGPHPAVVVLHGSGGRGSDRTARLLATHGYATLVVEYFGEADGVPDDHRRIPLSYFDAAVDWFRDRPAVADGQVGLFGVSRGGELALLLGARRDWVGAVVSYAGSGVAWDTPGDAPAWVDSGDPVPHLSGKPTPGATVEQGLDDEPVDAAAFAVEDTAGPILLVSGGDDEVWQSRPLSDIAVERLERNGFEYDYDHLTYDDVGHLISVPYGPLAAFDRGGGTARATAHAGADAWSRALDTFATGLHGDD